MAGGPPPSQTSSPLLHPCLPQLRAALWHPSDQRLLRQRHKAAAPPGERHTAGDAACSDYGRGVLGLRLHLPVIVLWIELQHHPKGQRLNNEDGGRSPALLAACIAVLLHIDGAGSFVRSLHTQLVDKYKWCHLSRRCLCSQAICASSEYTVICTNVQVFYAAPDTCYRTRILVSNTEWPGGWLGCWV